MPDKTYKCKKCQEEFQDLSEYRAHILHCKGEAEETEKPNKSTENGDVSTDEEDSEDEKVVEPEDNEKVVEPEDEKVVEPEEATEGDTVKRVTVEQAKRINTCRGNFEGNKSEICKNYDKCSQCWNDFRG